MAQRTKTFARPDPQAATVASESARAVPPLSPTTPSGKASGPRRLGRYELLYPIAAGGMAEVWAGVLHGNFGFRYVFAIKVIRPEFSSNLAFRGMFLDEARLASRVKHTNVVPVLDLGEEEHTVYQAMPLVEGGSLSTLVQRRKEKHAGEPLPLEAVVAIGIDAARGLHAAHEATDEAGRPLALVHRDVSPHNILVGLDGIAKIADFGIAKAFGLATNGHTETGLVKGKRAYLAPEQIRAGSEVDRRADIFSLGVVLWELLANHPLFPTGDSAMFFQLAGRIGDPCTSRPEVPPVLSASVMRALQAHAHNRYRTSEEFADALASAARQAGLSPTAKQVSTLVTDLVGREIESRNLRNRETTATGDDDSVTVVQDTRAASRLVASDPTGTHAPTTSNPGQRSTKETASRRIWPRVAGALFFVAASAGGILAMHANGGAGAPSASPPVRRPEPSPELAPEPVLASEPPAVSIELPASASPPATRVPAPRRRAPPPKPKFQRSPYEH